MIQPSVGGVFLLAVLTSAACKGPGTACWTAPEAGGRPDAGVVADLLPGPAFGWQENDDGAGGKRVELDWTWESPLPQGNRLNEVWGFSLTDVYAVGDHGTILHSDGTTWNREESGTVADLHDVWGCGTTVFAVGDQGTVLERGKQGWVALGLKTLNNLNVVWCGASDDLVVAGDDNYVAERRGGELAKVQIPEPFVGGMLYNDYVGISGRPTGEAWVIGNQNLIHYHDGKWEQRQISIVEPTAMWSPEPGKFITTTAGCAIDEADGITLSTSELYRPLYGPGDCVLASVWGNPVTGAIVAVGRYGQVVEVGDASPAATLQLDSLYLQGVWGVGDSYIAVGEGGDMFVTSSSGPDRWTKVSERPIAQGLSAISAHEGGLIVAAGRGGTVYRREAGKWLEDWAGTGRALTGIVATSNTGYVAVDELGTTYIRDRANNNTIKVPVEGQPAFHGVWADDHGNIVAVGDLGRAYHRESGDQKWQVRETGTAAALRGVWGQAHDALFAVGQDGTVVAYNGKVWAVVVPPDGYPLVDVWGASKDDVYAVGGTRILHYDGQTWKVIASGLPCGATSVSGGLGGTVLVGTACGDIYHGRESALVRVPSPFGGRLSGSATLPDGRVIWIGNHGTVLAMRER
jgi:hypothetical protein